MNVDGKKLFIVGDRVLVSPERGEERTRVGLVLPEAAVEKRAVRGGRIVEVGPGMPLPKLDEVEDEPWKLSAGEARTRYLPLEAKPGDFALFIRSAAIEIQFDGKDYLIVPYAAILVLVREDGIPDSLPIDDLEY